MRARGLCSEEGVVDLSNYPPFGFWDEVDGVSHTPSAEKLKDGVTIFLKRRAYSGMAGVRSPIELV